MRARDMSSSLRGMQVLVVDDDPGMRDHLEAYLTDAGCEVFQASNRSAALKLAKREGVRLGAAIVDLRVPNTGTKKAGVDVGLRLAKDLREQAPHIVLIGLSGFLRHEVGAELGLYFDGFLNKSEFLLGNHDPRRFIMAVEKIAAGASPLAKRVRSFIVHGQDDAAKWELKNYLQNTLGLPEPVILHELPSKGRTIIEKFEQEANNISVVFVLLTPDDRGADPGSSDQEKRRARQNVIFELGYFLGKLERQSAAVILLHKGPIELPSDISGVLYIDITNGVAAAGEAIRRELGM